MIWSCVQAGANRILVGCPEAAILAIVDAFVADIQGEQKAQFGFHILPVLSLLRTFLDLIYQVTDHLHSTAWLFLPGLTCVYRVIWQ